MNNFLGKTMKKMVLANTPIKIREKVIKVIG